MASPAPPGLELRHTLRADGGPILCLGWSPNGRTLATGSTDGNIRLWDVGRGRLRRMFSTRTRPVIDLAWSPDSKLLATTNGGKSIKVWEAWTGVQQHLLRGHTEAVNALAWSPAGPELASASDDHTVRIWNGVTGECQLVEHNHSKAAWGVAFSADGQSLASCGLDGHVFLRGLRGSPVASFLARSYPVVTVAWDPRVRRLAAAAANGDVVVQALDGAHAPFKSRYLEGHTSEVGSIAFAADGSFLASKCTDGTTRLWRTDRWEICATLDLGPGLLHSGLAFHPGAPLLASCADEDREVRVWALDRARLLRRRERTSTVHYSNAKVVLVGDSGVGKSGLGLALSGQPFAATESTHGRRVWTLRSDAAELGEGRKETREILLWDLAGQPGYRLIHQLHLNEVAVALVVFDARSEIDPFAGVGHWSRALRDAARIHGSGEAPAPMKRFLVAARTDRGGIAASRARIDEWLADAGFDGYFETSAKDGRNIAELQAAVLAAIDWSRQPKVSSDALFQRIKDFLVEEKGAGRALATAEDLFRGFLKTHVAADSEAPVPASGADPSPEGADDLRAQFDTCVGRVEARGLLRRLSFGGLVLLQPELIDAYASALIDAARDEPDGLGAIDEDVVRAARFPVPRGERLPSRDQERLLLLAMVEDLLRHEIALREEGRLIFPSQLTRENPDLPSPKGQAVIFGFEGPILNLYTTLAVRLAHSGEFARRAMWKNAAVYTAAAGGECGVYLRNLDEGRAELTLFFGPGASGRKGAPSDETRFSFEHFVAAHLDRRALAGTITRRPLFQCGECGVSITDEQARKRREAGHRSVRCPVCETEVSLLDGAERLSKTRRSTLVEMDRAADDRREREAAATVVDGKRETGEFDVFLAHNSADKRGIERIAIALRARGLNPWLDKEQIPPGRWFQDVIQQAIGQVKAAAIFVGAKGLGRWQILELRTFVSRCVESGRPVIPALLPGVTSLPPELVFLRELNWVRFESLDEDAALQQSLDQLVWGITGRKPRPTLRSG